MKKQRTSLFRVLILSLVMLVTLFIIGVAWFATKEEATASGLSIRSSYGLGLDSSFDDQNYATQISRPLTNNFQFPLITGNGTTYFIPSLDRSTGKPLTYSTTEATDTNPAGSWKEKRAAVATMYPKKISDTAYAAYNPGDYYQEDIYFRSSKQLDVYLTSLSNVSPASESLRMSTFGNFTRDYIAGAARVAFFEVTKDKSNNDIETPIFTWVPNEKYHLQMADDFQKIPSTGSSTGTGVFDPHDPNNTFGLYNTDKFSPVTNDNPLFTWEVEFDKYVDPVKVTPTKYSMFKGTGTDNNYYVAVDVSSTTQVDHGFLITKTNSDTLPNGSFLVGASKDNSQLQLVDPTYGYIEAFFENSGYSFNNSDGSERLLTKLTINAGKSSNEFFDTNDHFQLLFAYNPTGIETPTDNSFQSKGGKLQVIGFVYYNEDVNKDLTLGNYIYNGRQGIGPDPSGSLEYYSMENGSTIVITNNTAEVGTAYALNAVTVVANTLSVQMVQRTKPTDNGPVTYLSPDNPQQSQMFTVSKKDNITYQLKSLNTNKYLAISNGKIVLQDSPADFTLKSGNGAPMLKCGDYYLTFANEKFGVSTTTENAKLQIYMGTSYSFDKNSSITESYKYYNPLANKLLSLTETCDVTTKEIKEDRKVLLASHFGTSAAKVVTLKEVKDSPGTYKAQIRIRIWAEGTDNEAKIPLAGGIFTTHLEFQGVNVNGEPPSNPSSEGSDTDTGENTGEGA